MGRLRASICKLAALEAVLNADGCRPIFSNLYDQLSKTWSHYLHLQREAEKGTSKLLSTLPSDPVPGRRLLIIRDDNVPSPRGLSPSFDALMNAAAEPSAYQKYTSLDSINHNLSRSSTVTSRNRSEPPSSGSAPIKRWTSLKSMLPFGGTKPDELTIDTRVGSGNAATGQPGHSPPDQGSAPETPVKTSGSFKFSLEWSDRAGAAARNGNNNNNRKLVPPRLPHTSHGVMRSLVADNEGRTRPKAPAGAEIGPSKYTGRALAEWWLLLLECQNFFDRRQAEGMASVQAVETPTLTVENFRKPIG